MTPEQVEKGNKLLEVIKRREKNIDKVRDYIHSAEQDGRPIQVHISLAGQGGITEMFVSSRFAEMMAGMAMMDMKKELLELQREFDEL